MRTVTGNITAWLTNYTDPSRLAGADQDVIQALSFYNGDMEKQGWSIAGQATITIELVDSDTLVKNKVDSLRQEQQLARAEAQRRDTEYERKIQELLAITYEPA